MGHGITLTAGLLKGMKTYEECSAKYNLNYTRAYLTDLNPNFLTGIGASYSLTRSLEFGFYVIN